MSADEMPLCAQVMIEPFEKWALDFVGPISPMSHRKNYILVCTDYVTKWVEEKSLFRATKKFVVEFIYEYIFTRFGVPREIVTDQGTQFTSKLMKELTDKYGIKHCKYFPYHPQENGQVESTNKVLESILTKTIQLHHRDWTDRLLEGLWAYQTTWRNTTRHTPFELVYRKQVLLPIEFQVRTFRIVTELGLNPDEAQKQQALKLNELDEIRQDVIQRTILVQNHRSKWHGKFIKKNHFQPGDWAMLFDSRFKTFKEKLTTRCLVPYEVDTVYDNGVVKIKTIDDGQVSFVVNGHRLKFYHKPISKEDFLQVMSIDKALALVYGEVPPCS
jgi:hypothetical protein